MYPKKNELTNLAELNPDLVPLKIKCVSSAEVSAQHQSSAETNSTVKCLLGLGDFPRPRETAIFNPREIP